VAQRNQQLLKTFKQKRQGLLANANANSLCAMPMPLRIACATATATALLAAAGCIAARHLYT
jgi:hypothetical protein